MALVNLSLSAFFANGVRSNQEDDRWALLASYLARRLKTCVRQLHEKDFDFEAGGAESLQEDFERFVESEGDPDDFVMLWNELVDWAEATVDSSGTLLCRIPNLPPIYTV